MRYAWRIVELRSLCGDDMTLERYRSGHNEAVLKTVWRQRHMGSNPILSVRYKTSILKRRIEHFIQRLGEVPKRLKGHPWKGCRSLVAARGFKSLLLRSTLKTEQQCKPEEEKPKLEGTERKPREIQSKRTRTEDTVTDKAEKAKFS